MSCGGFVNIFGGISWFILRAPTHSTEIIADVVSELNHLGGFAVRQVFEAILFPNREPDGEVLGFEAKENVLPHAASVRTGAAGHQGPEVDDELNVFGPIVDVLFENGGNFGFVTHFGVEPLHQFRQAGVAAEAEIEAFFGHEENEGQFGASEKRKFGVQDELGVGACCDTWPP